MRGWQAWLTYTPAVLWYAFIFWLSSQPKLPGPTGELFEFIWFKTAHALFYAVLTLLVFLGTGVVFRRNLTKDRWLLLGVFLAVAILASLDEFHQGFVPGRHMRTRDVVIDSLAAAGVLLAVSRYNRGRKQ